MRERTQSLSDAVLLADMCAGCRDCFADLFRRYYGAVFASAYKILRDRSEAEDVAQEVFLSILQKREQYDPCRGQVKTWILTFAHFKALRRRRYLLLRRCYALDDLENMDEKRLHPRWKACRMSSMEWTQFVENGLAALTSRQKRTIELIHFEGYTLVEVSLIMGEGLSNIKNHYYRGMRILKEFLKAAERSSSAVETQDGKSMPVEATLPSGLQASPGNCTLS
jgi:RNA polymerase sigma-70 factor (ECF subfamily)